MLSAGGTMMCTLSVRTPVRLKLRNYRWFMILARFLVLPAKLRKKRLNGKRKTIFFFSLPFALPETAASFRKTVAAFEETELQRQRGRHHGVCFSGKNSPPTPALHPGCHLAGALARASRQRADVRPCALACAREENRKVYLSLFSGAKTLKTPVFIWEVTKVTKVTNRLPHM